MTREGSNDVSVEEGDVWSNNESSKKENKSYLCTSCHMVFENRKYLALFNESDYNFESDEVRKVLCKDIHLCSSNGKEYLCRTCRQYLKNPKKHKIPRKCVFAKRKEQKYKCSSCHEVFESSDEMVLVTEKKYNFECDVVKKVLSDSICCFDMYNNEYLCRECDECLDSWENPKVPEKSIHKMSLKFSNEIESRARKIIGNRQLDQERILIEKAGEKFRENCKELPEFVCTVCHHMMFKNGFHEFHVDSYKKLKGLCLNVLEEKYRFRDNSKVDDCGNVKEFICQNCDRFKEGCFTCTSCSK